MLSVLPMAVTDVLSPCPHFDPWAFFIVFSLPVLLRKRSERAAGWAPAKVSPPQIDKDIKQERSKLQGHEGYAKVQSRVCSGLLLCFRSDLSNLVFYKSCLHLVLDKPKNKSKGQAFQYVFQNRDFYMKRIYRVWKYINMETRTFYLPARKKKKKKSSREIFNFFCFQTNSPKWVRMCLFWQESPKLNCFVCG